MKPLLRLGLILSLVLAIGALLLTERAEAQYRPPRPGTFGGGVAGGINGGMPGGSQFVWKCLRCQQIVGTGPIRPTGTHNCPGIAVGGTNIGGAALGGGAAMGGMPATRPPLGQPAQPALPAQPLNPNVGQPGGFNAGGGGGIQQPGQPIRPPVTGLPPVAPPANTLRDDVEKAGKTASGVMIAAGIGVAVFGLLILGGVGFLIFQSQKSSSTSSPPPRRRRRSRDDYDD